MKKSRYLPSALVDSLAPSGIRAFFDLVLTMDDVISLGVGEPDFSTPWAFSEAAIYAIEHGETSYTSNQGLLELRQEISKFLKARHKIRYSPETEILITVGVSEALDLALRAILNPGEELLIPEPCYVSYQPLTVLVGAVPVPVPLNARNGFSLRASDIKSRITDKTRGILLNYPSNPTGATISRSELAKIAELVKKHDLIVLSDEIYDELTYDKEHIAFPSLSDMKNRTIYLNGFSKAYAMTGWRIGYACGPSKIIAAMTKIHQYSMLCAPIMGQVAARQALREGAEAVAEMKAAYHSRRNFMVKELNRIGLKCPPTEGAFYVFPSIKKTGMNAVDFAMRLLEAEKVAVVPGVAFGKSGEGHIRMSYAADFDHLKEAIHRIERFIKKRK